MDRRGNHAPMDFTYDNGIGPVNHESPFMSVGRNPNGTKRAFGELSPSRSQPASLRAPASSHSHLFSLPPNANKPLPPHPNASSFHPVDFTTPRQPQSNFDFDTSGADTPNTPDVDGGATPDTGMARKPFAFGGDPDSPSPKKKDAGRRQTFFSRIGFWNSPGRGEIPRGVYSHKAEKRIRKKRSGPTMGMVRPRRRPKSDDDDEYIDVDSDSEAEQKRTKAKSPRKKRNTSNSQKMQQAESDDTEPSNNGWSSFFSYLESHPNLPAVLSWYAQLLCNCFLVFVLMYFVWSAYTTIQADVDEAAAYASAEARTEISLCAKNYHENECGGNRVLPAMIEVCKNWERCKERDPRKIGRAKVSAHTFARIFNSFVEPISWKAMIFTLLLVFGTAAVSNLAFGFFRSKHAGAASYQPQQYMYQHVPGTPSLSRHASGNGMLEGSGPGYWTPHAQHMQFAGAIEPAPTPSFGRTTSGGLAGSPSKGKRDAFA